jgi:hypothetical protein
MKCVYVFIKTSIERPNPAATIVRGIPRRPGGALLGHQQRGKAEHSGVQL